MGHLLRALHCLIRYQKLQADYLDVAATAQERKLLVQQLEEDLRNVNALSSMFRGEGEGTEAVSHEVEVMATAVKEVTSAGQPSSPDSSRSAADSLLPIVQSQRERYRVRAQELEAQAIGQQQQITMLQNEIDKLRSDNVKLYEKVRYLQSAGYSHKSSSGHHDDGTLTRYSTQYEEKLDPFSSFNRKERTKRYMNLKPYDKITLSMGKFIMGNKTARTFAFFYTVLLHSLVFLVLYKLAHTESVNRDISADCHEKFAKHMFDVHGEKDFHDVHDNPK